MRRLGFIALSVLWAGYASAQFGDFTGSLDISDAPNDPAALGSVVTTGSPGSYVYTVTGGGSDWWNNSENGYLVYKPQSGEFRIETNIRVVGGDDTRNDWMKAGVFFRNDIDVGVGNRQEVNAISAITDPLRGDPDNPLQTFQGRNNTDDASMWGYNINGVQPNDGTVKLALQRRIIGTQHYFEDFVDRADGNGWVKLGSGRVISALNDGFSGLLVTSHNNNAADPNSLVTAEFTNVQYVPTVNTFDPSLLPDARTVTTTAGGGGAGYWSMLEVYDGGNNMVPADPVTDPPVGIGGLDDVPIVLDGSNGTQYSYQRPYINIWDSGNAGNFTPGEDTYEVVSLGVQTLGSVDQIAMLAEANVQIPADGTYSFIVNSDDGFELSIDGKIVAEAVNGKGVSDVGGTVSLTAGVYPIRLLYWEGGGGAAVEVFAGEGIFSSYDSSMALIGDTANGGLALVAAIPEPQAIGLFAMGLAFLALQRRRRV